MSNSIEKPIVMLVDDNQAVLQSLIDLFKDDYELLTASSGAVSVQIASTRSAIAAVVMDIKMEGMDGIAAAKKIRELLPHTAIIFHTGYPGDFEERIIDVKEKPFDYIEKGQSAVRLIRSVRNAVETYQLKCGLQAKHHSVQYGLIGQSKQLHGIKNHITKVAGSDVKVMILGETGTGKEVVSKAIHYESLRKNKALAILHCNHKSPEIIEAELFGHKKGAFTSATADRMGLFEYANGGTVFLDEIGDLDISTQAKLLRVLESGEYTRIGDPAKKSTNVRLICATNKNLNEMVEAKTFRDDLFYRLKGVLIMLPPLRERLEDIPALVEFFTKNFCSKEHMLPKVFDWSAIEIMLQYHWPGNVRQLRDTVESVIVMCDSDLIIAADVQAYLRLDGALVSDAQTNDGLAEKEKNFRKAHIVATLRITHGNIAAAAALLKIDKSNLRKYIIDHDIRWE